MGSIHIKKHIYSDYYGEADEIIKDKIYIGNELISTDINSLQLLKITHILVAGDWMQEKFPDIFKYLTLPIQDNLDTNLIPYID